VIELYDLFWEFANARLELMKTRATTDPVLQKHKFTNCYRACDRVSQYLIREVILDQAVQYEPESVLLRVLLFKVFNRIDTWEYLQRKWDRWRHDPHIDWRGWQSDDVIMWLDERSNAGYPVFTGVYRITSKDCYGGGSKHANYVMCIDEIMRRSEAILASKSLEQCFQTLLDVPLLGPFLSMQFCTDLGYTGLFPWAENDFIYPGPGCKRGISKTFGIAFGDIPSIMSKLREVQADGPDRFPGLPLVKEVNGQSYDFHRPLSLMDIQNLFCEFDKYLRVAKPEIGVSGFGSRKVAKRPKQQYSPARTDNGELRSPLSWPDSYVFPEKWYA
jgi:hypothetical protein